MTPLLRKSLAMIALWGNIAAPCTGELLFDWKIPLDASKKQTIERQIQDVAGKFKQKPYGDMGAYDFLAQDTCTIISIEPTPYMGLHIPGEYLHTIILDPAVLQPQGFMKLIALHELSHAYDHAITQKTGKIGKSIIDSTHHRAIAKEQQYLVELAKTIPFAEYRKVNKGYEILQEIRHVNSMLLTYEKYQFRGVPLSSLREFFFTGMVPEALASLWRPALEKIK